MDNSSYMQSEQPRAQGIRKVFNKTCKKKKACKNQHVAVIYI